MPTASSRRPQDPHSPVTVEAPSSAVAERAAAIARMMDVFDELRASLPPARAKAAWTLSGPNNERVDLPPALYEALRASAEILAAGESVMIVPVEKELTTQEAADMLNMSRQYLVRLLDANEIPHHRVNTHRRIKLDDLLAFKANRDAQRRQVLRKLTRITEDSGVPDRFPDQDDE